MEIQPTALPDVKIIQPRVFADARGYFVETWNAQKLRDQDLDLHFVQDNESFSRKGALRGIHAQLRQPQGKLARVVSGRVFDVAVDFRPGSATFGQWVGVELSEDNKRQLWIPPGFGHAYLTLSETAIFNYKCTEYYFPDDQFCLKWDDAEVGIEWPSLDEGDVLLSDQDLNGGSLRDLAAKLQHQAS